VGTFFMSWVPALCVLSSCCSLPHALHFAMSFFYFTNMVVSGYLHLVHRMYFSINLINKIIYSISTIELIRPQYQSDKSVLNTVER
jgi:hypothetical protein